MSQSSNSTVGSVFTGLGKIVRFIKSNDLHMISFFRAINPSTMPASTKHVTDLNGGKGTYTTEMFSGIVLNYKHDMKARL